MFVLFTPYVAFLIPIKKFKKIFESPGNLGKSISHKKFKFCALHKNQGKRRYYLSQTGPLGRADYAVRCGGHFPSVKRSVFCSLLRGSKNFRENRDCASLLCFKAQIWIGSYSWKHGRLKLRCSSGSGRDFQFWVCLSENCRIVKRNGVFPQALAISRSVAQRSTREEWQKLVDSCWSRGSQANELITVLKVFPTTRKVFYPLSSLAFPAWIRKR